MSHEITTLFTFKDVLDFLEYGIIFGLSFWACAHIDAKFLPKHVNAVLLAYRGQSFALDYPSKIIATIHAIICSACVFGMFIDMLSMNWLHLCMITTTAYMLYDGIRCMRTYNEIQQLTRADTRNNIGGGKPYKRSLFSIKNPCTNWFHHIVTVLAMHGAFTANRTVFLIVYMIGEFPIIFLNVMWYYNVCDSVEPARKRSVGYFYQVVTVFFYFWFRVVLFGVIGVCDILPNLNYRNPLAIVTILLFGLIYVMNIVWWCGLFRHTVEVHLETGRWVQIFQRILLALKAHTVREHNNKNRDAIAGADEDILI